MSRIHLAIALCLASCLGGCTVQSRTGVHAPHAHAQAAHASHTDGGPRQGGPELLGARAVGLHADHDVIEVGGSEGRFRRIRLHVSGAPLDMHNVRVVFGDGSSFSPPTRLRFDQGSASRDIDLPGAARVIRRVEFWYNTRGVRHGRAHVQLFGM